MVNVELPAEITETLFQRTIDVVDLLSLATKFLFPCETFPASHRRCNEARD